MRELTHNDLNNVSGGSATAAACIAGFLLVGMLGTYFTSHSYPYHVEPVYQNYQVVTPVYDPQGVYMGDVVDTYQDVTYKTVYS